MSPGRHSSLSSLEVAISLPPELIFHSFHTPATRHTSPDVLHHADYLYTSLPSLCLARLPALIHALLLCVCLTVLCY